ncbi:MAG: thioredoxin family protein, partial [Algicola sp.]|nr:thioredoxin family protein [Algicola sp.]
LTPSTMVPLGTDAPQFNLPNGEGEQHNLDQLVKTNGLLVVFMSNHCPYVIHLAEGLAKMSRDIGDFNVGMVGISANDADAYPDDSPQKMVIESQQRGYQFPYLYDQSQQVAKAYDAACTPDFFLFDGNKKLVYRGQFDDSRPGNNIAVSGSYIYSALQALKHKTPIDAAQKPSVGCNIKWR